MLHDWEVLQSHLKAPQGYGEKERGVTRGEEGGRVGSTAGSHLMWQNL